MRKICFIIFLCSAYFTEAQLKYIIEDFEGYANGPGDLQKNGAFVFGNVKGEVIYAPDNKNQHWVGQRCLRVSTKGNEMYGGLGKGMNTNVQLDVTADHLTFAYRYKGKATKMIRIDLEEDDDGNNFYKKEKDDDWTHFTALQVTGDEKWQLVSIPLTKFTDGNSGGDGIFNCDYKQGRFFGITISFSKEGLLQAGEMIDIDMLCFTKGDPGLQKEAKGEGCALGFWSAEGNQANFTEIASAFESLFPAQQKLAVIHFFQPFGADGSNTLSQYPSVDRVNKVIEQGYIPMITLENHFVNVDAKMKQPNLYSILEGHMDAFFYKWATEIKQMKGVVWVRILHEFNGNWYPWCIVHNDRNPELFKKAYWKIHDIFKSAGASNVKFIWCPNSMSLPQEPWNYIGEAYPGDDYVDLIGMDIYNGAGDATLWRSFRKEGIENYFLCTQMCPTRPIIICEVASRERDATEPGPSQTKAEWIGQMSEALRIDMMNVKLLTWFNEKSTFKLNSSFSAKKAFLDHIIKNAYFKSGETTISGLGGR